MGRLALAGIRVVEMSFAVSAPWAGRILASHGAQVIKVEAPRRPDIMRLGPFRNGRPLGAAYPEYAAGKRHITLDFRHPEARPLLDELLGASDVFIENVATDVVEALSLDFASLSRANPRLIAVSLPAVARSGPNRYHTAFGMGIQAYAGINALTGYSGEEPMSPGLSYPDFIAGIQASLAVVAALIERRRTGRGQLVEVSLADAAISALGSAFLQFTATGAAPPRRGNRHPAAAPHGTYRCRGEDRWVAIACSTDRQWQGLVETMGHPDWTAEPRFDTLSTRLEAQSSLDALLADWTRDQDAHELSERLQAAGVPAAYVARGDDLVQDPHLLARDYFGESDYAPYEPLPVYKIFPVPGRFEKTPGITGPVSGVGADNAFVLSAILGKSQAEIDHLAEAGVLG